MNYVTTNIRISEEDYLRLKQEAAKKRQSLSAVIRERIGTGKNHKKSSADLLKRIRTHAAQSAHHLEGVDIVKAVREMRYSGKW